jgi:SAM-dependent methyltransferase
MGAHAVARDPAGGVGGGEGRIHERRTLMSVNFGSGLHAAPGRAVDTSAYSQYIGRWSRLFIPALLAAANVASGHRVLDVAAGSGEAAAMALSAVERSGTVVGADISEAMLRAAGVRLQGASFRPVVMEEGERWYLPIGQALHWSHVRGFLDSIGEAPQ